MDIIQRYSKLRETMNMSDSLLQLEKEIKQPYIKQIVKARKALKIHDHQTAWNELYLDSKDDIIIEKNL